MNIPIVNRQKDLITKMIDESNLNENFIEIGCGDGHNLEKFSIMGMKGTGIDFSEETIKIGKEKKLKNIQIKEGDLFEIEEKNVGLVFLLFVLEHILNDNAALQKINSIQRIGGYLILSVPAHKKSYSMQDKLAGHFRRYNKSDLINILHKSGYEIEVIWSFGFPICNIYTYLYNTLLFFYNKELSINTRETKNVGIQAYNAHFPKIIRPLSGGLFKILSFLIRMDFLFLNTDLGTHYLVLAKKVN